MFHLLRNQLYLGKIVHKAFIHEGEHDAIVDVAAFEAAQAMITANARRRQDKPRATLACSRLTGRIFDAAGGPMSPTHARGKSGKLYRYYVSAPLQQGRAKATALNALQRVSAAALEDAVQTTLARLLPDDPDPLRRLLRVEVQQRQLLLELKAPSRALSGPVQPGEQLLRDPDALGIWLLTLPIALSRVGCRSVISAGAPQRQRRDPAMIAALRRAHALVTRDAYGPMLVTVPISQYGRRLAGLALLAPDIQQDILAGRQPQRLTLAVLMADELPLDWGAQRAALGFGEHVQSVGK